MLFGEKNHYYPIDLPGETNEEETDAEEELPLYHPMPMASKMSIRKGGRPRKSAKNNEKGSPED